jgi:hypothetical protein
MHSTCRRWILSSRMGRLFQQNVRACDENSRLLSVSEASLRTAGAGAMCHKPQRTTASIRHPELLRVAAPALALGHLRRAQALAPAARASGALCAVCLYSCICLRQGTLRFTSPHLHEYSQINSERTHRAPRVRTRPLHPMAHEIQRDGTGFTYQVRSPRHTPRSAILPEIRASRCSDT